MRVLIVSAFFAVAAAAPSNLVLFQSVVQPVPTISPGDIQAAAIDAQVQAHDAQVQAQDAQIQARDAQIQAEDYARAAADKAQELNEQATENINEKVVTDANIANERSLDAFWSAQNQQWQAINAAQIAAAQIDGAAAQIDGAVASNAGVIAKSAIAGPYAVVAGGPVASIAAPVVGPVQPVVYTPFVAPLNSIAPEVKTKLIRTEIKEEEKPVVKAAESEKVEENKADQVATPATKAAENLEAKPAIALAQPWSQTLVSPVSLANLYRYDVALPGVGPVLAQPVLNYATSYQQINGVLTPTLVNTVW